MQVGALDRRISIQTATTTRDSKKNAVVKGWTTTAEVWANRRDTSSREFFAAGATNNEQLTVLTIRYRPGIAPGLRAVCDGQIFTITGVSEIGRRQFLALQGKAVNSNAA